MWKHVRWNWNIGKAILCKSIREKCGLKYLSTWHENLHFELESCHLKNILNCQSGIYVLSPVVGLFLPFFYSFLFSFFFLLLCFAIVVIVPLSVIVHNFFLGQSVSIINKPRFNAPLMLRNDMYAHKSLQVFSVSLSSTSYIDIAFCIEGGFSLHKFDIILIFNLKIEKKVFT